MLVVGLEVAVDHRLEIIHVAIAMAELEGKSAPVGDFIQARAFGRADACDEVLVGEFRELARNVALRFLEASCEIRRDVPAFGQNLEDIEISRVRQMHLFGR